MSSHRTPLLRLSTAAALLVGACSAPAPQQDNGLGLAITKALDKRFAAGIDFSMTGQAEQGAEKLPYGYAMKQPTYVRAAIGDNVMTFDGKLLLVVDNAKKVAQKKDLSALDDATKLLTLHQAFANFVCEGWRPPLLRPSGFTVARDGDKWIITVPIDDDTVKEQRLVLKAGSAELVEKSIVDKQGKAMTKTLVTEELVDPATGMQFPKAWETTTPSQPPLSIRVEQAVVNGGLAVDLFKTDVPAGYSSL